MNEEQATAERIAQAKEQEIAEILAKYPTPRALAEKLLELDEELALQQMFDREDDSEAEELLSEAQDTLERVREQILKGDTEYAVELIGREIGF
jgi:endonuclease III